MDDNNNCYKTTEEEIRLTAIERRTDTEREKFRNKRFVLCSIKGFLIYLTPQQNIHRNAVVQSTKSQRKENEDY